MKKFTYAFVVSILLLTSCSQDEGFSAVKDELVTLNYNVSLGSDVLSRTSQGLELEVNKLICAVFDEYNDKLYSETKNIDENGKASFSPKLFNNTNYKIVFWAYYQGGTEQNPITCYHLDDLTKIRVNERYDKEIFDDNAKKDAFTYVDHVNLSQSSGGRKSITLTRPFGQVNVLTSAANFEAVIGSKPENCKISISGYNDVYDALNQKWCQSTEATTITLTSNVSKEVKVIDGKDFYYLAKESVFSCTSNATCCIEVYNAENGLMYSKEIQNLSIKANAHTNLYNENLLVNGSISCHLSSYQFFAPKNCNKTHITE